MKRIVALLFAALCLFYTPTAAAAAPARDARLQLQDYVLADVRDSSKYAVNGYRLVAPIDLSVYRGRYVTVKGFADFSEPNVFTSCALSEITVSGATTARNAAIFGALLYDYNTHTYRVHDRAILYPGDIAPLFGKFVCAQGLVDSQGVLITSSLTQADPAFLRKFFSDEIYFAEITKKNSRLKEVLCDGIVANGTLQKDSLYKKLANLLTEEDGAAVFYLDGRRIYFDPNAQPAVKNKTVVAPVSLLCSVLGLAQAQTFAPTDDILLTKGTDSVTFTINKRTALVNGKQVKLPVAPYLAKAGAMLPVRFLCEQFGYRVMSAGNLVAAFSE